MTGFSDPITGGGILVQPEIRSPNFVPGVSGWIVRSDGSAEFQSIVVPPSTGGATVFIQATAPTAFAVGDLWFDSSNGFKLNQWTGTRWQPFQYSTQALLTGGVNADRLVANSITAAQIAAATITATQIAAGTITAANLVAGIVVAGIVDATTITGAQFIADGSSGEVLVYSGAPATGNLIAIISGTAATDGHSNTYLAGISSQDNATGVVLNLLNGLLSIGTHAQINAGRAAFVASAASIGGILTLDSGKQTAIDADCQVQIKSSATNAGGGALMEILGALLVDVSAAVSATGGGLLTVTETGGAPAAQPTQLISASAGDRSLGLKVAGDADMRLAVDSNGQLNWGPGNVAQDVALHRLSAGLLGIKTGSLAIENAGQGFEIKEGSNARMGLATLSSGSVVVANTSITTNTRIFLTPQSQGSNSGFLSVSAKTAGTGFTIHSSNASDGNSVAWLLMEPA